ncbi:MAG: RICIN domain-containing protein [Ruminococcus sp.]|nr:RICIN domain-containing protein [Ruminococcus sp.]
MKFSFRRAASAMSALVIASTSVAIPKAAENFSANAASNLMLEYLDRGISAVNTGKGMLVSWRYLANDDDNAVYKLYRDGSLIYTSEAGQSTCYLDAQGSASSKYRVDTLSGGKVIGSEECKLISNNTYFDVPMTPPTASDCTYSPNDMSVGDIDGDGQYELFVKWDPSNSKDNSQSGKTGNVFIDCVRLDGTRVWRIDLGKNIRAGAHYTQFYVADFDLDGKAEMTCKTADGTVDGTGKVIGDASKDYRNSSGYILSGSEYYTLFDGATGAALDTVDYEPARGDVSKWGDKYGNRVDRFWGSVAYVDGVHPSVITGRGYYTRLTATCYSVENKKLVKKWTFDTGNSTSAKGYGDGNHNSMPADVDGDGKQEIVTGAACIDDNGKLLWNTGQGHGDALHLADLDPTRDGLELWICHEDKKSGYGVSYIDAKTGKIIFHNNGSGDTGRCCADNIWAGNPGAELWGNKESDGSTPVKNVKGDTLSCNRPAINFLSYWDGDLEREILDGSTDSPAKISKMNENGKLTQLLSTDGYYTCNTTKGTPCLSADIFGDWREELIVRAADSKSVRIYCTSYDTDYRITTLMHDAQYRMQVSSQNTAYNQPPHPSFFLGTGYDLPARPTGNVNTTGISTPVIPTPAVVPAVLDDGAFYMIKNVNSGLYMEVADASAKNGANVQQWGADGAAAHNVWRVMKSPADGYYYLYSALADGASYCLDLTANKKDNGTNIELYQKNYKDAQQFMFVENNDGSFTIRPRLNPDSCVEVINASTESGANIQEWELNGASCQNWILEKVDAYGTTMDTSVEYMFKNVNSGLYMEVANGSAEDNANVQQWGADSSANHNTWTLKEFGGGYYYIISKLADGRTYYLNVADNSSGNGANAEILTNNKTSSHLFKFIKNPDGTYNILTRASRDKSGLEVANAETASGSNIQQWVLNGNDCQKWSVETIVPVVTTTTTTTTVKTTVTTVVTEPPVSSETTTTAVVPESKTLLGDANEDGSVDIADATAIVQHMGNPDEYGLTEQGKINADIVNTGDGVTGADAVVLQLLEAKKIKQSEFPVTMEQYNELLSE